MSPCHPYRRTPVSLKAIGVAVSLCVTSALLGCGGSSDFEDSAQSVQAVTAVSVANAMYQQQATFTVTGADLTDSVGVTSSSCKDGKVTMASSSSSTQRTGTCTIVALGPVAAKVIGSGGGELYNSASLATVPRPQVTFATTMGDYTVELRPDVAPITSNNMLANVAAKFYDNTIFHYVAKGTMISGGAYDQSGTVKTGASKIKLESTKTTQLSHTRGAISMFRDAATPDSATASFLIMHQDTLGLNWQSDTSPGYAAFGAVVSGLDVIDKIAEVAVTTVNGVSNFPTQTITIKSAVQTK